MAQSIKFISIDGELALYDGRIGFVEDVEEYAESYGSGEHYFETSWYSVGEGENGMDEFIPESEIESMLLNGLEIDDVIEEFEKRGYFVELIQSDSGEVKVISGDPEDYEEGYIDDDCGFDPYMGSYSYDC